jgi:exopolysaccharide production protein ExoZ
VGVTLIRLYQNGFFTQNQMQMNNLVGLQYLRGLAALMVVAHHADSMVPNAGGVFLFGSAGVDIFFVISGFVMAHSTRNFDPHQRKFRQAIDFLTKRFIRVVPLYWLALLWTIKVEIYRGTFSTEYWKDFAFLPRVHFTGNIWPQLIVGWTINYEIFFYLAFALSMLAGKWRYKVVSCGFVLLAVFGAVGVTSDAVVNFYLSPLLIEFLAGIALSAISRKTGSINQKVAILSLTIGMFVLSLDNGAIPRVFADGIPAIVVVWAAAVLAPEKVQRGPLLIGDASYSIYLFHLGLFSIVGQTLRWLGLSWLLTSFSVVSLLILICSGLVVGIFLHLTLERYLLRKLAKWRPKS